jgi:hypothetical protein
MKERLTLKGVIPFNQLTSMMQKVAFRGLFDKKGAALKPYAKAKFKLVTVHPPQKIGQSPKISVDDKRHNLFTPQPTIYENQLEVFDTVDKFLRSHKMRINDLRNGLQYYWEGRGDFHILPPIIEKHTYELKNGYLDLDKISNRFKDTYTMDARNNLHNLSKRFLNSFYIDEVSKLDYLDVFNSNAPIINYGLRYNGKQDFYIICDGSHRIDYAVEKLGKPITAILVEPESERKPLLPYYAFPVSFVPTVRLTSKKSEKMYPRLERDKIHLLNDFIKKTLHYDWEAAQLSVSKLRSNL